VQLATQSFSVAVLLFMTLVYGDNARQFLWTTDFARVANYFHAGASLSVAEGAKDQDDRDVSVPRHDRRLAAAKDVKPRRNDVAFVSAARRR